MQVMGVTEENKKTLFQLSHKYIATLVNYLSAGETEKAVLHFQVNCDKFHEGDIAFFLNALKKFVTFDTFKEKPKIFNCVYDILFDLAEKANPEIAIFEYIELGETAHDHAVLLALLKPLQVILDKLSLKRGYSLMWCLSMIEQRLKKLPAPKDYNLQGEERKLMDCDPVAESIVRIYRCIEPFYNHFVSEVSVVTDTEIIKEKMFLIRSIITILGHPLVCNDLQNDSQSKSELRVIAENLVRNLSYISNDLLQYLSYTKEINKPKEKKWTRPNMTEDVSAVEKSSVGLFDIDDEIPVLGLGVLYYLIIGEHEFEEILPCVYSPLYIFHKGLSLTSELLKCAELQVIYKGLVLAEAVIAKIPEGSLSSLLVETEVHSKFIQRLQPVMVYCPVERHRRFAVTVLHKYLSVLDRKCQYLLLIHLLSTVREPATIAFLVTYIKDVMLKETKLDSHMSPYFRGRMLHVLVKKFCVLPEAEQTDLIQHMAPINAVLNFIRFMILRDKRNDTEFRGCLAELRQVFLVPLEDAINLSRSHFQLELELEEKKLSKLKTETREDTEISVTVLGKAVNKDRLGTIQCSLTYFDLMESLLCRVNECLEFVQA